MYHPNAPISLVIIATLLRYIFFAGFTYLLFYILFRNKGIAYKIQAGFPKNSAIQSEIKYSLLTGVIFGLVIYVFLFSPVRQYTRLYRHIHDHSMVYYFFSIIAAIAIHDTYFYWTHRLMHWKKIFPYMHHIHHKSHNPTPWAAYAFHPLEALIEIGVIPIIVFTIPMHGSAMSLFGLYMIVMNVMGHLGYEIYPKYFMKYRWLRWMNTSTHHNMHHKYSKCNYGLYFNIWDQLMNTNHQKYKETFEAVKAKKVNVSEDIPANAERSIS